MEFTQDADENSGRFHKVMGPRSQNPGKGTKNSNPSTTSAISKKKILAEKNDSILSDSYDLYDDITSQENAVVVSGHPGAHSRVMPLCSKVSKSGDQNAISSDCSHLAPYDPLINYTSPRPEFLRYNPNRCKEILQRIEGEMKKEEEGSEADWSSSSDSKKILQGIEGEMKKEEEGSEADWSSSSDSKKIATEESSSVSSTPLQTSFQDKDVRDGEEGISDAQDDDDTEEEEVEVTHWYCRIAWRLLLLLGVLLPSFFYIYFMNYASVPTLKEYGGLEDTHQMIRYGGLDQRTHNGNKFPGNFWGILMGLSNECFDIHSRELSCPLDGFKREVPEEKDLEEGISIIHLRNLTEDEQLNENFLRLDDTARKDASEEKQSFDENGTELITERYRDTLLENGTLGGVDLVAEEMSEEVGSSNELEQEPYIEGNPEAVKGAGSEKVEILEAESAEVHNIAQLLKESSQVSETELLSIDSSFGQDALNGCGSFEPMKDFGEEAQVMGNSGFDESLQIPQSKIVPSTSSNNQKLEESEISSNSDIKLKWDSIYLSASKYVLQLLYILICLSTIIVFNGLHKYFLKFHKISPPESRIPPALKPAYELALEKKSSSVVSAEKEVENKGSDSDVYQMPLTHSNDEQMKFKGVQPPAVELLSEFSVVEGTISGKGSRQKVRMLAASVEESQFFQSQRKISVKKTLPSSANKVHPSPLESSSLATESISTGNFTVRKLQKKKDAGEREEPVKLASTPLRRSSRLRKRVTSP